MKLLILLSLIDLAESSSSSSLQRTCAFVDRRQHASVLLFGIRGGGDVEDDDNKNNNNNDYDKAETAIFHGIAKMEERVQKAVEDEVHSIFDADDHDHKQKVVEHAKTAVKRGTQKVKDKATASSKIHDFFLPKHHEENPHDDHRILHALEAAETAVLHAVEDEVDTLFHPTHDHDHEEHKKAAQDSVKRGLQKAAKDTKEDHKERRLWMDNMDAQAIDEYLKSTDCMYGLGY